MRPQIAAANWKMNLTYQEAEKLLNAVLSKPVDLHPVNKVLFAVPFPYLIMANSEVSNEAGYSVAAQNCSDKASGAYTGEIAATMIASVGVKYCIVGHSERREYFGESNTVLARKIDQCLEAGITPIFCCGEALAIREAGTQNSFVETQLKESLFHLETDQVAGLIIAYEPVWAIGTGKTASAAQAQEMHAHIRSVLKGKWGAETADAVSILYGGSVKASNAAEIFAGADVDGGLVGGASLVSEEFIGIIKALKS